MLGRPVRTLTPMLLVRDRLVLDPAEVRTVVDVNLDIDKRYRLVLDPAEVRTVVDANLVIDKRTSRGVDKRYRLVVDSAEVGPVVEVAVVNRSRTRQVTFTEPLRLTRCQRPVVEHRFAEPITQNVSTELLRRTRYQKPVVEHRFVEPTQNVVLQPQQQMEFVVLGAAVVPGCSADKVVARDVHVMNAVAPVACVRHVVHGVEAHRAREDSVVTENLRNQHLGHVCDELG